MVAAAPNVPAAQHRLYTISSALAQPRAIAQRALKAIHEPTRAAGSGSSIYRGSASRRAASWHACLTVSRRVHHFVAASNVVDSSGRPAACCRGLLPCCPQPGASQDGPGKFNTPHNNKDGPGSRSGMGPHALAHSCIVAFIPRLHVIRVIRSLASSSHHQRATARSIERRHTTVPRSASLRLLQRRARQRLARHWQACGPAHAPPLAARRQLPRPAPVTT